MKNYLFPHHYRRVGWVMLALAIPLAIVWIIYALSGGEKLLPSKAFAIIGNSDMHFLGTGYFKIEETDWTIQILVLLYSLGCLFTGFSREKDEDEYIGKIRFEALAWSVFVNTGLVIISTLFIYGIAYIYVMYGYAFSLLTLFVCRYFWKIHQFRRADHEE
jgi:hypothetical protein